MGPSDHYAARHHYSRWHWHWLGLVSLVLIGLTATRQVSAQVTAPEATAPNAPGKPLWEVGFGAGVGAFPDYPASSQYQVRALPFPYFIYRGSIFKSDSKGVRAQAFNTGRARLEFSAGGALSSNSNNNNARSGMPNLDFLIGGGPNLAIGLLPPTDTTTLTLNFPVRAVFSSNFKNFRYRGVEFSPFFSLSYLGPFGPEWRMVWRLGTKFASQGIQDYFYSVAPQYVRPGRPEYRAHGGYLGSYLSSSLRYQLNPHFTILVFAELQDYQLARNDHSPLFKSRLNGATGIGFAWSVFQSREMAKTADTDTPDSQ